MSTLKHITWVLAVLLLLGQSGVFAQSAGDEGSEGEEVYLAFRYKGAVNTVITAIAKDEQFYLPVTEIFSLLEINYQLNIQQMSVSGYYIEPDLKYTIGFRQNYAQIGDQRIQLSADDILLRETDFYMLPSIFQEVFGLKFSVDFYHLELNLESERTVPVVAQQQRSRRRSQASGGTGGILQEDYPLLYDRNPQLLDGGFLDYSAFARFSQNGNLINYTMRLGGEVLAGDLQGSVIGAHTSNASSFGTSGMRWRFVRRNQPALSTVEVGQVSAESILNNAMTGVKVSNEPIEPRRLYDNYVIDGNTIPQSEVELYRNNQLIGFEKADDQGYYRFTIPLTYGSADLSLRIYNPSGGVTELDRRIQVPFTYLPPGELYYNIAGGKEQATYLPWAERRSTFHTDAAYGVNNRLTGKFGIDYQEGENNDQPIFYSSLATRLGLQYLVNLDIAPGYYYRLRSNATYPSSAGWRVDYTYYPNQNILNLSGREHELNSNLYYPFAIGNQRFLTQFSGRFQSYPVGNQFGYRSLLSTNISRFRLRLSYQDVFSPGGRSTGKLSLTGSLTIPRAFDLPQFFRGMYLRSEISYLTGAGKAEQVDFQVLKSISREGRFRFSFGRNLAGNYNTFELSFSYDFDKIRSTSSLRINRNEPIFTQNFRGSVGYDSEYNTVVLDNRQQVGRSGASIRMFVDGNDSGTFDAGEEQIQSNAIRIRNATGRFTLSDSVSRLTQLQAYRRYNLEVNEAKIRNPVWVPKIKEFSIVTDPNSFKQIDVPFFITGIIDGKVVRRQDEQLRPVAGLRMHLDSPDGSFHKTLRTFSDGSFYAMEVPPGEYQVAVDSTQLQFLGVESNPQQRTFRVEALPEGDFVEGLDFTLTPRITEEAPEDERCRYFVQVGLFSSWEQAILEQSVAGMLFGSDFRIVYNQEYELYAVLSELFSNRSVAMELRSRVRERLYDDAFVGEDCSPFEPSLLYRVHLGSFNSQAAAENFADSIQFDIPDDIIIKQYAGDSQYRTILSSEGNWQSVFQQIGSLKNVVDNENTFVIIDSPFHSLDSDYAYRVQVGVYGQNAQAVEIKEQLSNQTQYTFNVETMSETGLYLVRTQQFSSLEAAIQARQTLSTYANIEPTIIPEVVE
ncbi:MAG: SPOR domain-containing protein [Candidatus Marinimicrobia bacterium]|nr:SPOR domain-containing protein [Candidatus Neomarinimicrobiota bacterium]MCF7827382.1 SPOR domain-containing protein [Candidatus Neomarinimicrobiota bacterium]MCF7881385.1 SPOR domain-containing protein [Candidatus Neomarinimicrobiota bacterium]